MYKRMYLYASAPEAAAQNVFMAWLRACSSAWGQRKVAGCSEHGNGPLGPVKRGECFEELRNFSVWRRPLLYVICWLVRHFPNVCLFYRGWVWKTVFFLPVILPQVLSGWVVRIYGHMWPCNTDRVDWTSARYAGVNVFGSRLVQTVSAKSDVVIYSLYPLFLHVFQPNVMRYAWL